MQRARSHHRGNRTLFEGDPETRRKVSFSVAIIVFSAKMTIIDVVVNDDEVRVFRQTLEFPEEESRNVVRLYNPARQDVADYQAYTERPADLGGSCDDYCGTLENVIDSLLHLAKAEPLSRAGTSLPWPYCRNRPHYGGSF